MGRLSSEIESRMALVNEEMVPLIKKLTSAGKTRMEVAKGMGVNYQSLCAKINGYVRWQMKDFESAKNLAKIWGL